MKLFLIIYGFSLVAKILGEDAIDDVVKAMDDRCKQVEALSKGKRSPNRVLLEMYCQNDCDFDIKVKDLNCDDYVPSKRVCEELQETSISRGWLTDTDKLKYCSMGCDFSKSVKCHFYTEVKKPSEYWNVTFERVSKIIGGDLPKDLNVQVDDETQEVWLHLLSWISPVLLSLFPPLLNQYRSNNIFWSTLFLIVVVTLGFFSTPWSIVFHNTAVCLVAYVHPSNSSYLAECLTPLLCMLFVFLGLFIAEPIIQISILFGAVVGSLGLLYHGFFIKRGGSDMRVILIIFQLWVIIDLLQYAIETYAVDNLGGATFAMLLNCFLPNGPNTFWFANAAHNARLVAIKFTEDNRHRVFSFLACSVFQFVLTLAFKACFGAYCLRSLRYHFGADALGHGLMAYLCDFYGPPRAIFRAIFKYESFSTRRIFYGLVGLMFLHLEWFSCREMYFLRFVCSSIDKLFIDSSYQNSMRYLGCDVHLQIAFPQRNALPWVCIDELKLIADNTRYLYVTRRCGKVVRGVACAITVNGRNMLYTVKHVVKNALSVRFGEYTYNKKFEEMTESEDPVVFITQNDVQGPEVRIITADELRSISYVACINVHEDEDKESTSFVCMSTDFHVKGDRLFASISLKKGDSGGPVFAVLNTGEVRFAGTVSAGRHDQGGGNIFAFAISTSNGELESSDDESYGPHELATATYYNKVRNRYESGFSYDDPAFEARRRVTEHMEGKDFIEMRKRVGEFGILEFKDAIGTDLEDLVTKDEPEISIEWFEKEILKLEQPREKPSQGDDHDEEHHKKRKKRFKNWKKERARKKRHVFGLFQTYANKLNAAFVPEEASAIYYETLRNGVPKHAAGSVLTGFNGAWYFEK